MHRDGRHAVYSVYYADDGRATDWSTEPMPLTAERVEDLAEEFERFRRVLSEPVLDYETAEPPRERPGGRRLPWRRGGPPPPRRFPYH